MSLSSIGWSFTLVTHVILFASLGSLSELIAFYFNSHTSLFRCISIKQSTYQAKTHQKSSFLPQIRSNPALAVSDWTTLISPLVSIIRCGLMLEWATRSDLLGEEARSFSSLGLRSTITVMRHFQKPSERELQLAFLPMLAWRAACRPEFFGIDNVPDDRPLLFVGNHQIFGVLDIPLLFHELYLKKNIFLRSLGDHHHFMIPGWGGLLHRFGAVDGTPENCRALLAANECVLVFPGGGREVAKRKNEKYKLIWKERLGFVRMALEFGCTIVPFAAVGVEDWFEILFDGDEIMSTKVGQFLERLGVPSYAVMPIARGSRGLLPKPSKQLFYIGKPFETKAYQGRQGEEDLCRSIRDEVKSDQFAQATERSKENDVGN